MAIVEQATINNAHVQQSGNINVHQLIEFVRSDLDETGAEYNRGRSGRNAHIKKSDRNKPDEILGLRADSFAAASEWGKRPASLIASFMKGYGNDTRTR